MEKNTFRQRHPLFSKPVIGTILSYVTPLLLTNLLIVPVQVINSIFGNSDEVNKIAMSVVSIIALFIHKRWFREEFSGCFYKEGLKDKKVNLLIVVTFVCVFLVSILPSWINNGITIPSVYMLTAAICAGVSEETIFRAFPVSILMRGKKSKKLIIFTLILTSLVFGLVHLSNLKAGATVQGVTVQVISASFSGLLLCAIYLRTGNIFLSMLYHSVYDYACFMATNMSTGIVGNLSFSDIAFECGAMVLEVIAVVLLLRGHTEDIVNLWNEIWKLPEEDTSSDNTNKIQ